jgi:hypothetical protein
MKITEKDRLQGQLSNEEFMSMYEKAAKGMRAWFNPVEKTASIMTASIMYGKSNLNYYIQHSDGSWTCYDTKTIN